MARSARTALVLGRNALATDVAARIAASAEFGRVVTVALSDLNDSGSGIRCSERLDPSLRGADRELADLFTATTPSLIVHAAVSESPTCPERPWVHDERAAFVVAAALRNAAARAVPVGALLMLSSTAVYGTTNRRSPLLFDEEDATARSAAGGDDVVGRWAGALAAAEITVAEAVRDAGWRGAVLRAAPVVGGPVRSQLTDYLAVRPPVRVLGYDPLVQVLHYDDLLDAILLAVRSSGVGVFNLVGRGAAPLSRLTALAGNPAVALPGSIADLLVPRAFGPERLRKRSVADGRRAESILGFAATQDIQEAIRGER